MSKTCIGIYFIKTCPDDRSGLGAYPSLHSGQVWDLVLEI
jgi:hypothetical protein